MDNSFKQWLKIKKKEPEDAAHIVAFLASEDANWITDQIIHSEHGFYQN